MEYTIDNLQLSIPLIGRLALFLDTGDRPESIDQHSITYHFDNEQGETYARVEVRLPLDTRAFAEVEGETYGQLLAFRVYIPAVG